ncbi:MAG: TRAP transporter permease [Hyphomicrobiales bacterium]
MIAEEEGRDAVGTLLSGEGPGWLRIIALVLASLSLALAAYQMLFGYFPPPGAHLQRVTHLSFVLALAFLIYPLGRKSWDDRPGVLMIFDVIGILCVLAIQIWITWDIDAFLDKEGRLTSIDIGFFVLLLVLILETTRRAVGMPLVIIAAVFIFHTLFSNHFIGPFRGPATPLDWLAETQVIHTAGIFGLPIYVMATYVSLFIIFAVFLVRFGTGQFFIDLAYGLMGGQTGGPAKVAVVASSMFATVSGTTVGNVVGTGSFTIPLMKRVGYAPHFAGGVEAAASTGGQIMPPIMGAAAFVMAEFMGVPYSAVVAAAAVPASLYFIALFFQVHFEAKRLNLKGQPRDSLPSVKAIMMREGYLLIPIVVLVVSMFYFSTIKSALYGIAAVLAVAFLSPRHRPTLPQFLSALERAARMIVPVSIACAAAGIIIGCIAASGVGIRFSTMVAAAASDQLWIGLVLTMLAGILLGMGITTTAVYITLAVLIIPTLIDLGAPPMAAHMFALYFGVVSNITPPVALAGYAAAGLAEANPMRTSFEAWKLGLSGFIVPFMFVYHPALLLDGTLPDILVAVATAMLGVICLAAGLVGWFLSRLGHVERAMMLAAALCLIAPGWISNLAGIAIAAGIFAMQWRSRQSDAKAAGAAVAQAGSGRAE